MIRNMIGAYVIIGSNAPFAVLLGPGENELFRDRERVSGIDKAVAYTFGHTAEYALPCTADCMEFIALNFTGKHSAQVRQMCARIALGKPIGDGKDLTEGGQGARIDAPLPGPVAPAGIVAPVSLAQLAA